MAIVGPTAAGKSEVAMAVARRCEASILSVDSMQVYRGMDIGTAKPSLADQAEVRHHMIDVARPETEFTVAEFRQAAATALAGDSAPVVLIVGGSGLHFRSVVDPMAFRPTDPKVRGEVEATDPAVLVAELVAADPHAGDHIDLANPRRVRRSVEALRLGNITPTDWAGGADRDQYRAYRPDRDFVGVALDRAGIETAIAGRLALMRQRGFLAEVEALAPRLGRTAAQAVGYRQLLDVVAGRADADAGFVAAERATMGLVKRQRTFFRRDPRLTWLDADHPDLVGAVLEVAGL